MHRYRLRVEGGVQGVGFRWYAQRLAERFCLTGWVENCEDGAVALEVQGQDAALCDFLELLAAGRGFIEVETIHKKELPLCDETRFSIR